VPLEATQVALARSRPLLVEQLDGPKVLLTLCSNLDQVHFRGVERIPQLFFLPLKRRIERGDFGILAFDCAALVVGILAELALFFLGVTQGDICLAGDDR
jgi:hypothetical protein